MIKIVNDSLTMEERETAGFFVEELSTRQG